MFIIRRAVPGLYSRFDIVEKTSKLFTKIILLIAALMTARVIVWFFEQRAHDRILADLCPCIPFLLVILSGCCSHFHLTGLFVFQKYVSRKNSKADGLS